MSKLNNKVIWITGASSGIGETLAYELSRYQVKLILSARREIELKRVKDSCEKNAGAEIEILPLDLAKSEELALKTSQAEQIFGRVDVLINNGGISQRDMIIKTSMEVDRRLMEVNYFGSIALSK